MKKTYIIITALLVSVVIGLFVAAFILLREPDKTPLETVRDTPLLGGAPEDDLDVSPVLPGVSDDVSVPEDDETGAEITPLSFTQLHQLAALPIAGAAVRRTEDATFSIRYIEKASGNTYDVAPDGTGKIRITNTTIPAIYAAVFNAVGSRMIGQYLDEANVIKSFAGAVRTAEAGATGKLEGEFLADHIRSFAISPEKNTVAYTTPLAQGSAVITSSFDGTSRTQIFTHPLSQWQITWPRSDRIALTTAPSAAAHGFSLLVNTASGRETLFLRNIAGLTTLYAPDTSTILYAESVAGSISTKLHLVASGQTRLFPVVTLPEKCVWSKRETGTLYCGAPKSIPASSYPDDWYKGYVTFSDELWKINIQTGSVSSLADLELLARGPVDVTKLFLDDDETHLYFTDKVSETLWSFRLEE